MADKRKKKLRADFRKHHQPRKREIDVTRRFEAEDEGLEQLVREERVSGKGEVTRRRTVVGAEASAEETGFAVQPDVDARTLPGRVLRVLGLLCEVEAADGRRFACATRRLLKTLATDQRHVVIAGDRVSFRPANEAEGIIERIEPRRGVLSRAIRGRQQAIAVNVDQALIVASAADPKVKPNLIDRMIVAAERGRIEPVVCVNKIDLVEPADLAPLAGVYGQMGYRVLLVSARTGAGVDRLRRAMAGRATAVAGQSGVGKSSLLNAVDPGLRLRVGQIVAETRKGRHTTSTATLLPLASGGYVVDTPGIRQFQLWDVVPEEVAGYFRDLRPLVPYCRFPDCTHTHEEGCAVKDAVADDLLDERRYDSYCALRAGDE